MMPFNPSLLEREAERLRRELGYANHKLYLYV
jgi:hypothetical protein